MKHALMLMLSAPLVFAAPTPVEWSKLAGILQNVLVQVETKSGPSVRGVYQPPAAPDSLSLLTAQGPVTIASQEIGSIQLYDEIPARRLRQLRKSFQSDLRLSRKLVFSPLSVLGLAHFGITTSARAVALPFCAFGDFVSQVDWSRPNRTLTLASTK